MILGPLSINDDKDENEIQEMYEYIYKLRSKILSIDKELQIKSKNLKISINTFKNYTRFPISILKTLFSGALIILWINIASSIKDNCFHIFLPPSNCDLP